MAEPPKVELCVFCRRHPVEPACRPFCSERCRTQDLARWADGAYSVPGAPAMEPEETENEKPKTESDG
jgi:endogenous inhibitor of DNA gyrase (YacG/DUF329 family)